MARFVRSAGGIVIDDEMLIVVRPVNSSAICLPKGLIDPGETPQEAAVRECFEEAAVSVEILESVGMTEYWYRFEGEPMHKTVEFFLMRYLRGDPRGDGEEIDCAYWLPIEQALVDGSEGLTYPAERDLVNKARSLRSR